MPTPLKRFSTPPFLALLAVGALALVFVLVSGSGSQGSPTSGLAAYAPPETVAYAETDLKPDGRVSADVDRTLERLTGMDLVATLDQAFGRGADIDYLKEIQPWAAGPVAISTGDSRTEFGLVAQAEDPQAAETFATELRSRPDFPGAARVGVIDGNLAMASSQGWFDRISAAADGESLADTPAFIDSTGKLSDGGLGTFFLSNEGLLRAVDSEDFPVSPILKTLGLETENTGTAMTLNVEGDRVRLEGSSGLEADAGADGAEELIASFPADSLLAVGVDGAGRSLTELIDAVEQSGAVIDPGAKADGAAPDLGGLLDQNSAFGVDLPALIESLDQVGVFATGTARSEMSGAIVATTSDPELVRDSIQSVSDLGAFAGGDFFRTLGGELEGFSVALPGMSGRVVAATSGDRLAIGLGVAAVRQALLPGSSTLGDTALFQESTGALAGDGLNLFARPSALAPSLRDWAAKDGGAFGVMPGGKKAGKEKVRQAARMLGAVESVVAGSGDDGSFELDLNLNP